MVAPEPTASAGNGRKQASESGPAPGTPHPLDPLLHHLAELREYAATYVQAKSDAWKLSAKQMAIAAVLGLLGLVAGIAMIAAAAVMVLDGIARGLAELLGGRLWAGELITGLLLLIGVAVSAWLGVRSMNNSSRRRTIERYEHRYREQQARYGYDAAQRAQSPGRPSV